MPSSHLTEDSSVYTSDYLTARTSEGTATPQRNGSRSRDHVNFEDERTGAGLGLSDPSQPSSLATGSGSGVTNPCYITVENDEGVLEKVEVDVGDEQFTVHNPIMAKKLQEAIAAEHGEEISDTESDEGSETHAASEAGSEMKSFGSKLSKRFKRKKTKEKEETPKSSRGVTHRRLVSKAGTCNTHYTKVRQKDFLFFKDFFTTAVDMQWRYVFLGFSASFILTWTIFAGIWYLICHLHDDFLPENLPGSERQNNGTFVPCVLAMHNFASCYLFSVETQHTIGYGSRQTTEECPEAIIVMTFQSIIGVLCSATVAGIVFAKLARPKSRSLTVTFSKNAVVTQIDGALYLIFRVSNMRRSHLIETHVRAQLVHAKKVTEEKDTVYYYQEELKLSTMFGEDNDSEDRTLMILPNAIYHRIDEESPFYELTPKEILNSKFEMVVVLEGIVEPTGNSVQARTSYLPREILWGYQFENMVTYTTKGQYSVDLSSLNAVIPDDYTSLRMSASDFAAKQKRDAERAAKKERERESKRRLSGLFRKISSHGSTSMAGSMTGSSMTGSSQQLQQRGRFMQVPLPEEESNEDAA